MLSLGHICCSAEKQDAASNDKFEYQASGLLKPASSEREEFLKQLLSLGESGSIVWDIREVVADPAAGSTSALQQLASWLALAIKRYAPGASVAISPAIQAIAESRPDILESLLPFPAQSEVPRSSKLGWDTLVDPWVDTIPAHGNKIPSAYRIWKSSRRYFEHGELERARRCEELNYLIHNSYVPARLQLRGEVTFAYGGIGVIIHPDADISTGVTIGANVTIGGSGSQQRVVEETGKLSTVPKIREYVTIGACANISGGIDLGPMSIVAPNSVVTRSVSAGEIVAGAPARTIAQITRDSALRYKVKFLPLRAYTDSDYMAIAQTLLPA